MTVRVGSRKSALTWQRVALVAAALLVLAGCDDEVKPLPAEVDAGAPAKRGVAHLQGKNGTVTLERDGKKGLAQLGYLYVKDVIETGEDGDATVRFQGSRVLELGPDGRLVIGEDASGLVVEVQKGFVLTRIPKDAQGTADDLGGTVGLSILTPFGLTRVGGSSEVKVALSEDGATVDVLLGSVELVSRNGETQKAEAGDVLTITQGAVQFISRGGGKEIQLAPIEVTLSAVSGRADVKKKDKKAFTAVGKKPQVLEAGDTIRTVKTAIAMVQWQGSDSRVQLLGGTEAVFDGSGKAAGIEEAKLQLKKGGAQLRLRRGIKTRVNIGDATLESAQGGQFGVQRTGDGVDFVATVGDATILREGVEPQALKAGQRVRIGKNGVKVDELGQADFVIPSKSALKIFHPNLGIAALTWEGGKKDYVITVANDSAFKDVVLAGLVHEDSVNVPIPSRGLLFWKVQTPDGNEVDRGSAIFAPEPPQRDLARLRNEVPEGTEKTTIYYQDKPPAVTFLFSERENAAQYKVTVYRATDLSRPAAERVVSQTSAPFSEGLLTEGSYRWSVTPLLKNGQEGEGGRMNKLDIVYDNSVPQILVRAPRNGDRAAARVPVAGVAPVGSRVYINGKPAPLDDKHRFEGSATPIGRQPLVIFRTTRASEPDVFTVRQLRRGR